MVTPGAAPRRPQRRLLERWCDLVAPEAAEAFQACYTASLMRGDDVLDSSSGQVRPGDWSAPSRPQECRIYLIYHDTLSTGAQPAWLVRCP